MELADLVPEPALVQIEQQVGSRRAILSDYADPVVQSRVRTLGARTVKAEQVENEAIVPHRTTPVLDRPDRAPVGGHVHRLAIPGSTRPGDGECRDHLGRSWVYRVALKAWQRVT